MIDFDEIRKELAIRHNVLLGKDDPILVTVTLNELVLKQYLDLVESQYAETSKELTVILQQHVEQSKQTAGKIITEASNYVSEQVHKSMESTLQQVTTELKKDIQSAMNLQRRSLASAVEAQSFRKAAYISAITAGVSALIAVGAVIFAAL
ncbi:hypothetical protein [Comamonas endophytica]|uniref:Transcriptional activator TraM n=1 Tax=Comamonas endophytica TaxID=2949090 RepID=A0ABY6GGI8_9BURK|nr:MULTISPECIES: hypothetical protein [unclassified Acidovorax]MCD2514651.1 hypothetical protein [Acidovorax sp. D4N7]UYG53963.1 hypothetical protein M9799_20370 [Acidovorax sp. 5MLIR]UYG54002.1 hypothetical protein M9799_19930 [Acidovorax sp. 5MLIR]